MSKKTLSLFAVALFLATPAVAQDDAPTDYDRALAAGYKAQFLCSGLWNGNKTREWIEKDELTGIYDRIADIVPTLDAEIDESAKEVRVAFANDMPPRIARWQPLRGCFAMPIGFDGPPQTPMAARKPNFDDRPWPMGDRNAHGAVTRGYSKAELAARSAMQGEFGGKTSAILIIGRQRARHVILAEQYKSGHNEHTAQRTWSVAKSIAGTLVGHSVQRGVLDVNDPALVPEWQNDADPRKAITYDQLLRMASGLYSDTAGNRTDPIYTGGTLLSERTTGWPLLYPPGSRYRYANNDTMLAIYATRSAHERDLRLVRSAAAASGDVDFDPNDFFRKIGMTRTVAETDWQGNYILSSQVWTTARDMARLGLLYLNNGIWEGERLLPENWLDYVSAPSGPQPEGRDFGYGATFWLINNSEGIPPNTIAAMGNRGQYLVIVPSRSMVIVRRGYDTRDNRFDIVEFTRNVLETGR